MKPMQFLEALWRGKPARLYILIWTRQGKRSRWFNKLRAADDFVEKNTADVYVGVGLSSRDYGPDHRCPSNEIAGIAGLWADFDIRSEAHAKKSLPTSIEEALTVISATLPPTIVVATGNGAHAWWLFKEPWVFENDDDRKHASALSSRFHTLLHYRASQYGWAYERLSDLARLLRIAGTVNAKDLDNPKKVTVHASSERRYNPSDFKDYLDDLAISDGDAAEREAKNWTERFADAPLAINLNARISQDALDRWIAADLKFKKTWLRQREDLPDQSQSGYDMALACFGVRAGLAEQEIIDLIVHHRFIHKEKPRTSSDYFQRTISKAANRSDAPSDSLLAGGLPPSAEPALTDGDSSAEQTGSTDPAIVKAQRCDRLSQILGIPILRLVKITGKAPVFRMEFEAGKIEFKRVADLVGQHSLRMAIAAQTNHLIPKYNAKTWEKIAQMLLHALTEEDGGEEMQLEGAARAYVTQYLQASRIYTIEAQGGQNARGPIIHKGDIAVSSTDMLIYINKMMCQNLTLPEVTGMLSVLGARTVRVRGKHPEQGRWALPRDKFDPTDYSKTEETSDGNE